MAEKHRVRTRQFKVNLLDEELNLLSKKSEHAGMTKSKYIRRMIVDGNASVNTTFSREDTRQVLYELNRIGNNINQIAYKVNAKGTVDADDLENLRQEFLEYLDSFAKFAIDR